MAVALGMVEAALHDLTKNPEANKNEILRLEKSLKALDKMKTGLEKNRNALITRTADAKVSGS
jgi:hypothetical protein